SRRPCAPAQAISAGDPRKGSTSNGGRESACASSPDRRLWHDGSGVYRSDTKGPGPNRNRRAQRLAKALTRSFLLCPRSLWAAFIARRAIVEYGPNRAMKVLLFGATGMVGQGVLRECLLDPGVERVLSIVRAPSGNVHEKLIERVHGDFFDWSALEPELVG